MPSPPKQNMPIQATQITHLTFDCYGTLIDWENGILSALQSISASRGLHPTPEKLLQLFVANEARLEAAAWKPYQMILQEVTQAIAGELGFALKPTEQNALADSLPSWLPFPDTVPALRRLAKRFRLVILSNIDDALFAPTARRLEVPFHEVITAEQVRSYKPGEAHFREALRRLEVPASQILHVAQSLYHDHPVARRLGFQTAWVRRPSRLPDTGLAPAAAIETDVAVDNLAELADLLE